MAPGSRWRAGRAAAAARSASARAATCPTGVVSEGDAQLRAATARAMSAVNGAGVKVGILSDSFNALGGAPFDVANGELPGAANPCGFRSAVQVLEDHDGTDEGRAMAQIVHDLAPGATLAFRTAFNGQQDFANGIRALRDAGAKVIVDDVSYADEPMFQDGVIAAAIDDVEATGVAYFSSAANTNMIVAGQDVGSYEAPAFRPIACPTKVAANGEADCHDFDPGAGTSATDQLTVPGDTGFDENEVRVALGLERAAVRHHDRLRPLSRSTSSGAIVANTIVDNIQSGEASEILDFSNTTSSAKNYQLVIAPVRGDTQPAHQGRLQPAVGFHRRAVAHDRSQRHRRPDDLWPQRAAEGRVGGRHAVRQLRPHRGVLIARSRAVLLGRRERHDACGPVDALSGQADRLLGDRRCVQLVLPRRRVRAPLLRHLRVGAARGGGRCAAASAPAVPDAGPDPRRAPRIGPHRRYVRRGRGGVGPDRRDDRGVRPRRMRARSRRGRRRSAARPRSSAAITWTKPASLGSPVTSYRITRYTGHSSTASADDQHRDDGDSPPRWAGSPAARSTGSGSRRPTASGRASASGYSAYVVPPFASLDGVHHAAVPGLRRTQPRPARS